MFNQNDAVEESVALLSQGLTTAENVMAKDSINESCSAVTTTAELALNKVTDNGETKMVEVLKKVKP